MTCAGRRKSLGRTRIACRRPAQRWEKSRPRKTCKYPRTFAHFRKTMGLAHAKTAQRQYDARLKKMGPYATPGLTSVPLLSAGLDAIAMHRRTEMAFEWCKCSASAWCNFSANFSARQSLAASKGNIFESARVDPKGVRRWITIPSPSRRGTTQTRRCGARR